MAINGNSWTAEPGGLGTDDVEPYTDEDRENMRDSARFLAIHALHEGNWRVAHQLCLALSLWTQGLYTDHMFDQQVAALEQALTDT